MRLAGLPACRVPEICADHFEPGRVASLRDLTFWNGPDGGLRLLTALAVDATQLNRVNRVSRGGGRPILTPGAHPSLLFAIDSTRQTHLGPSFHANLIGLPPSSQRRYHEFVLGVTCFFLSSEAQDICIF